MSPLVLDGNTLGQKHQHYNKLVREAVSNKQTFEPTVSGDDIQNLLEIDVACKTRNVQFLLEVLKSEDSLYVSRAIKNSKWLITDKQYSHIINPAYLHTQLFPEMTSKAINKLLLSIRLNLKDEDRAEAFYMHTAEKDRKASYKWLEHCSVTFIENELKTKVDDVPIHILMRLVRKSLSIFEISMKSPGYSSYSLQTYHAFPVKMDPEKYLDVLALKGCLFIKFSPKETRVFMTRCPNRVIDNFEFFLEAIHLPTFVKYLKKKQDIKTFLLKHVSNENISWFYSYKYLVHFIKHMSTDSKFDFVKMVFIDKGPFESEENGESYRRIVQRFARSKHASDQKVYQWYQFAPFDVAFTEIIKLIRAESSPTVRNLMLQVLLSCASQNKTHVLTVLKYYQEKHINEPFTFLFVNTFLLKTNTHEFDNETWGLLNQLFQSMEVYVESDNNTQSCIKSIIIRHVIRGEKVPQIITTKFTFDTLKQYQRKLKKQEEKDAVFTYLHDYMVAKHDSQKITNQSELSDAIGLCENHLNLLKDWKKDLQNYPFVIKRVKNLITIKQENSWNTAMDSLYNVNKSWKKIMFNESFSLCPSEAVCVNALKYDPGLLVRHKTEVENMLKIDVLNLTRLLRKVRIYWSNTLAEEWKTLYLNRLEKPGGYKSLVMGLCTLLPQKQLNDVAKKYAPSRVKIDWNEIDELAISLQKQIAKNISKARPLFPLDTVLWYAKGDYLQYAVPSLNSILSQLSANKIRKYLPKLLDSSVSLQKFGVRCSLGKLTSQELKPIFTEIWNSTKNSSIRTVLFTHTHALLCKEKNTTHINDIWELLSMFIDNLSSKENKLIYKKLGEISDMPLSIRVKFFMKSYIFLKALPAKANCKLIIGEMDHKSLEFMEFLNDDFVVNIMFKDMHQNFTLNYDKHHDNNYDNTDENDKYSKMIATFMLSCKDEEAAVCRYERFLAPMLDRTLPLWNKENDEKNHVKANLKNILIKLVYYINDYSLVKKKNIPVKIYQNILLKLEARLSLQKDYVFLTSWKLAIEFIKLVEEHKDVLAKVSQEDRNESQSNDMMEKLYGELHAKIAPNFAKSCVQLLKQDVERIYPTVYILFSKGLVDFFDSFLPDSIYLMAQCKCFEYLVYMLQSSDEKEVYLLAYFILQKYLNNIYYWTTDKEQERLKEIRRILFLHPSEELKLYYYQLFHMSAADWDAEK